MKLLALVGDTLREIYARKAIIGIVIIEVLALIAIALFLFLVMRPFYSEAAEIGKFKSADSAQQEPARDERIFDAEDSALLDMKERAIDSADTFPPLQSNESDALKTPPSSSPGQSIPGNVVLLEMVKGEMSGIAIPIMIAFLFFGIFICAGIIPSMMEKGTIDLLASKPISRTSLLLGRVLGGLLTMAINLLLFVVAVWLLYGLASGIWYAPFILWTFLIPLFAFIVIYSGIILLNVLTESSVLPMILTYIHMTTVTNLLGSSVGGRESFLFSFTENTIWRLIIDGLYYLLPQIKDFGLILYQVNFTGRIPTAEPFIQGTIFITVMLGLAAWQFERKDF